MASRIEWSSDAELAKGEGDEYEKGVKFMVVEEAAGVLKNVTRNDGGTGKRILNQGGKEDAEAIISFTAS